jgi:hypothetical protein
MRYLEDQGLLVPMFDEVERVLGRGLPFPVPALISEELSAGAALALWAASREHTRKTGLVPVLLGAEPMVDLAPPDPSRAGRDVMSARGWARMMGNIRKNQAAAAHETFESVVAELEGRVVDRFSAQVVERLREAMQQIRPVYLVRPDQVTAGPGVADEPAQVAPYEFLADPEPVRCILLGCRPWETPLYLGFGGRGACPPPPMQAIVLRRWWKNHGTEIVHIGRSTVAMHSARPPQRIDALRPLLWDVFLYCYDAVFRDADDSFAELRTMLAGNGWQFWWDQPE